MTSTNCRPLSVLNVIIFIILCLCLWVSCVFCLSIGSYRWYGITMTGSSSEISSSNHDPEDNFDYDDEPLKSASTSGAIKDQQFLPSIKSVSATSESRNDNSVNSNISRKNRDKKALSLIAHWRPNFRTKETYFGRSLNLPRGRRPLGKPLRWGRK